MKKISKYRKKFHIKKGDTVRIIAGNDRNKEAKVLRILRDKDRAIVEGCNKVYKHIKPNAEKNVNPGIIQRESSIHISNLSLIDSNGNATRIGRKRDDNNKLKRYSKKTGEFIN